MSEENEPYNATEDEEDDEAEAEADVGALVDESKSVDSFPITYNVTDEKLLNKGHDYVLGLCQDSAFTCVAAGLSDTSAEFFHVTPTGLQIASTDPLPAKTSANRKLSLTGINFLNNSPHKLLVGDSGGTIRLFDLRSSTQKEAATFDFITTANEQRINGIVNFDRNSSGNLICAGSVQSSDNVFAIMYDVRAKQIAGYYEDFHDDITCIKFNKERSDIMTIGCVDGLINVFDVRYDEEEGLCGTVKIDNSVSKLQWVDPSNNDETWLYSISCSDELDRLAYDDEGLEWRVMFDRHHILSAMHRKNFHDCNSIDTHTDADGNVFLLASSTHGGGRIMSTLQIDGDKLLPHADFVGNRQIVRTSVYDPKSNIFITAGEGGMVTLWTTDDAKSEFIKVKDSSKLKAKSSAKPQKVKPY